MTSISWLSEIFRIFSNTGFVFSKQFYIDLYNLDIFFDKILIFNIFFHFQLLQLEFWTQIARARPLKIFFLGWKFFYDIRSFFLNTLLQKGGKKNIETPMWKFARNSNPSSELGYHIKKSREIAKICWKKRVNSEKSRKSEYNLLRKIHGILKVLRAQSTSNLLSFLKI